MIVDSNMKIAVTCEKCGRINIEELNLFDIKREKQLTLTCSCGSLNCIIYSSEYKNININAKCIYCGEVHNHKYKSKEILNGTELLCPEIGMAVVKISDRKAIKKYIKDADKNAIQVLYDESFELFFNDHDIMKKSLEKLRWLKENSKINCDCGNGDISMEVYSDRIELKCLNCQSIKIIYAENQQDLDIFYKKKEIDMKQFKFEFIDSVNNSDKENDMRRG